MAGQAENITLDTTLSNETRNPFVSLDGDVVNARDGIGRTIEGTHTESPSTHPFIKEIILERPTEDSSFGFNMATMDDGRKYVSRVSQDGLADKQVCEGNLVNILCCVGDTENVGFVHISNYKCMPRAAIHGRSNWSLQHVKTLYISVKPPSDFYTIGAFPDCRLLFCHI